MANQLKVTLVKSLIGRNKKHIEIAQNLGLNKIRVAKVHQDNPCIRGMLNKINYLVKVEECAE